MTITTTTLTRGAAAAAVGASRAAGLPSHATVRTHRLNFGVLSIQPLIFGLDDALHFGKGGGVNLEIFEVAHGNFLYWLNFTYSESITAN
mgnify:CR=1 FL=1